MHKTTEKRPLLSTFSRRIAKGLKPKQKLLLSEFLPKVQISLEPDFEKLGQSYKSIWLEIGFGNGEFLIKQALDNPDILFIGCEPFLNGVASLLGKMEKLNINNIRIFIDDARKLLETLPDNSLDKAFIICPDPWPKRKHYKRRLINQEFLELLFPKINSELIIATDHTNYAEWILKHLQLTKLFKLSSSELDSYTKIPNNWVLTKYQSRGKKLFGSNYFFLLTK